MKRDSRFMPSKAAVEPDAAWPGLEPTSRDQMKLQKAMKRHQDMHSLQEAAQSIQTLHVLMQELESRNVIPNKNAMQIYLQHCCAKSASFEAADIALWMMERHGCRFEVSTVVQIAMQVSLRADMCLVAQFVRRLLRTTLLHLQENELSFLERHMTFVLAERKESTDESMGMLETFAERGLRIDWESSTAQEFHIYNTSHGTYKPTEGYGFAKKNLVALLSIDPDPSSVLYSKYCRHRDGAIVDVIKAGDGEPLVVRFRMPVTIPFHADLLYRLDHLDTAEVQTKRMMESLKVLGRDPQSCRLIPHTQLCQILLLPPEEQYTIKVLLRPKDARLATLDGELDFREDSMDPIRVTSLGSGVLSDWNHGNPGNQVQVGDRVVEINGTRERHEMVDEILTAQGFKYELAITLMRKVKVDYNHVSTDMLLPSALDTETVFVSKQEKLSEKLNKSQIDAVRQASTQRLCLIQGPPGTGKTTTAVELLDFLLTNSLVPTPILVSGHTNAAVDNILVGLIKKQKRVVRVGEGEKVRAECRPYVLGEERAVDPKCAEVICATCIGSGSGMFSKEGLKFHTVLIDECSQATETACLVPICRAAQQLILIGDQCQLQPMIKSDLGRSQDLGVSLFNRLCRQGICPAMLDTQYRMHPAICDFPSGAFYNGLLKSGVCHANRIPTRYWEWPSPLAPVCFIDAKDGWDSSSDGQNEGYEMTNQYEVDLVMSVLEKILQDPNLSSKDEDGTYPIGIITPYAAQKELIVNTLKQGGLADAKGNPLIETNSVDGFQGREKDIIIFSAVRSNDAGTVGFLHDWRRINVMLTRSKRGLIVIGNRETLKTDFYWKSWLKWASTHGCIPGETGRGTWTPICLVEDEWVIKPQALPTSSRMPTSDSSALTVKPKALSFSKSVTANQPEDSWGDAWLDCGRPTMQCSKAPALSASAQDLTSWEDLATDEDPEVDVNASVASWEDLATDMESESDVNCLAVAEIESGTEFSTADSLMTESLECSTIASQAGELLEDFLMQPMQSAQCTPTLNTPTLNDLAVLPPPTEATPDEAIERVRSSLGSSMESKIPPVSRLRSELGQQRQRERQKQRRKQHHQADKQACSGR